MWQVSIGRFSFNTERGLPTQVKHLTGNVNILDGEGSLTISARAGSQSRPKCFGGGRSQKQAHRKDTQERSMKRLRIGL